MMIDQTLPFGERVSATEPDWSRERRTRGRWSPSQALIAALRDHERIAARRGPLAALRRKLVHARHRLWSIVAGADIPLGTSIGGGLRLPHPNGIVIHPDVEIGPNCMIYQQVTIGSDGAGVPRIGGHVDFGAGAKVLGPISIGDHVLIGANAVVIRDVPSHSMAVGVPARIVPLPQSEPGSSRPT